jgi:hypothetical protein
MWADQPPVRAQVNIEVNMGAGTSAKSRTMAAQNPGAWVLSAVDAVPEAHQPFALVEECLDVALRVTGPLDLLDHPQHARGSSTVQGAAHRTDGT